MSKFVSFLLLLISIQFQGFSQSTPLLEEYSIDVLNVRRGLLSNFVTKVVSDEKNLKFFATEGGISKFDGYNFTNYQPGEEFPGLENENIETLFRDRENLIWIGTKEGGLSALDTKKNSFRNFNNVFSTITERKLRVISINQAKDGSIWIGTWSTGVFVFDPKTEELIHHFPSDQPVYNIIRDRHDNIWYIAGKELHKFDPSEDRKIRFRTSRNYYNLVEDASRNKIWLIGNQDRKIALGSFDFGSQEIAERILDQQARFMKTIALDSQNRLWLGSWGDGLFISNSEVTEFRRVKTTPQDGSPDNINYSIILSIDFDAKGIAWLGTAQGGVLILYPNKGFEISRNLGNGKSLDYNVTAFYRDPSGIDFQGTLTEGVFYSSRRTDFSQIDRTGSGRVNCFYQKSGYLFIGTSNGLFVVKNQNFSDPINLFPNQKITSILWDSQNRLWLGTQQSGLKVATFFENLKEMNWTEYSENSSNFPIPNNRISQIKEDNQRKIWIATYSGINAFREQDKQITSQSELLGSDVSHQIINDFHLSDRVLYLATPKGLVQLEKTSDGLAYVKTFDKKSGLSNDFICSIEEDLTGNLWISTITSIAKISPNEGSVINFDREDGVMLSSFHIGSSFLDQEGKIYFGGSNGLISFHPEQISEDFSLPEVVLTKLTVNNRDLQVGEEVEGKVILENVIQDTDRIELGYSQNHLSLSFTANDFLGADNIFYAYQLKGLQDEWISLGPSNQISFTGLPSGDYELVLRASRNNQDWSPNRSLFIHIDTPPWLTWPAFLFYGLAGLGILFLIRYISRRQARLEAELRIIQIEKEKDHELNEAKIMFFTNISHEFRTPLTLILSPITELLSSFDLKSSVKEKLFLVETNAFRMLRLINQLLDFRKSEHGLLKLNVSQSEFVCFAKEVYLSFKSLAIKKKIDYHFESQIPELQLTFDRNQLEIVLCNLLSNAFKYTKEKGQIKVLLSLENEGLKVSVVDNGIGMSSIELALVFDRFYQVQNAETSNLVGSGIGLAFSKNIVELHDGEIGIKSESGVGTEIYFILPVRVQEELISEIQQPDQNLISSLDFEQKDILKIENPAKVFRILIADDNEDIRLYLRSMLELEYEILEAGDGLQALELIQQELPDLVISDVMMPKMDGIKLCHEIKSQINTSHIPVILLTARTSIAFEMDGLQTGAEDYITKPFNPGIVKTRVHNILENRKKLRDYFLNKVRFEPDSKEVVENDLDAQFIEKAIALVNGNLLNEDFGIEIMMENLNMSQSTLFRKIKSLTGLSITAFIRSVKLKKAAQIILQSDLKLSQVAYEVGFNDYKHFKKSFQQQFGCLPSAYKQLILQKVD
jgi:signal transduction histidine kinase/ligand-binding sensor domain-containing protein/AraC-like DNA-binding protein